jgi:hypothetical protein
VDYPQPWQPRTSSATAVVDARRPRPPLRWIPVTTFPRARRPDGRAIGAWWAASLGRWYGPLAFGLAVVFLLCGAVLLSVSWRVNGMHAGEDLVHYLDGVRRWWATGNPYLPNEIARPFDYEVETFLHPPVSILFFAPWLVLPPILWWAIPIGITAGLVIAWRPAPWTWPLLAFGLAQPPLHEALIWGNSNLWLTAALALSLVGGPWAALFLIKPSLGMLAFVGIRRTSWWKTAAVIALLCVPFGLLWLDWAKVILNSPADATYSLRNLPWVLLPVVAWAGRTRDVRIHVARSSVGPAG